MTTKNFRPGWVIKATHCSREISTYVILFRATARENRYCIKQRWCLAATLALLSHKPLHNPRECRKKREQPRRFQGQGFLRLLFWQLARHAQNLPATAAAPQPITNRTNSSLWIPCSGKPHLHKPVCHAVHFWIRIIRGPEWAAPESKSFSLCCTRSCTRLHHQQIDYSLQKERIKNYFYLEINTSTSLQWRLTNEWAKAKQHGEMK